MRFLVSLSFASSCLLGFAQHISAPMCTEMHWRMIGPYRGGRTVAATGIPGRPNEFFIGVNNGGVWKTTDFGQTWHPIFDDQPTGSIGALAVAPSAPDTIYVGSGEGLQRPDLSVGDGIYKSTDGGNSWSHLGLRDGQQITGIAVDPKNPDRVFAAVLGHPYGPNAERGIFRSLDGGQSWQKVLYKDEDTGAAAVTLDPSNAQTVYACLWQARQGPWENGGWSGPGSGLYKSADGGATWNALANGLPTYEEGLGRIGIGIAPSNPNRIYAVVEAKEGGVFRSDDAGKSWTRVNSEQRVWGRGDDFAEIKVDPHNPDVVYVANTSTYKSTDGGRSFISWKGAPGGDDYHTVWVNSEDSKIILLAGDQGATITVNGGQSWSSWYNQPTAQFYHVSTDNQIPYYVYGGQQESGSARVLSRGNDGEITDRDWHPVGAEEYGYVAPDPLNPNIVYGGKLSRCDMVTGQVQDVSPAIAGGNYRFLRTAPLMFAPTDPHTLYFAGNVLFKTTDGGQRWEVISPDLTRTRPEVPDTVGVYRKEQPTVEQRGVIYALGPSPLDGKVIWAGTDDGLVQLTRDGGKQWANVSPPGLTSWSKIAQIDAGHFSAGTAYVAVNRLRLDDLRPHVWKTEDFGATWAEIDSDLPQDAPVNVVREDPQVTGLLYCGTEHAVYFSLDDGKTWNPLRLNMPATSIRDLVVHGDDLVVGTHGRSFWILDDITPLRQLRRAQAAASYLCKPEVAYRFRRDTNTDTPLPPDIPAGENPPDGAIIDYYQRAASSSPVVLSLFDAEHHLVRRYSSDAPVSQVDEKTLNVPLYWVRPKRSLENGPGMHRFVWDLFWEPLGPESYFSIAAIYRNTPPDPTSPIALPGRYSVALTVDGHTQEQPLELRMDPRVKTQASGIEREFELAKHCYERAIDMRRRAEAAGEKPGRRRFRRGPAKVSFGALADAYAGLMGTIDSADATPTQAMEDAVTELDKQTDELERGK